jgi:FkbM family methyltransferase
MKYYSQDQQDYNLENYVFKGYKNGFFVDIGAHDGKTYNNTLFFEENHKWTGINVEPLPNIFEELIKNRPNCINLKLAVDNTDGESEFSSNTGSAEMLSGLVKYYDPRHLIRIQNENIESNGKTEIVKVQTKRLDTILKEYNVKRINYLSIDVEGGEFNVLKSINFDEVFIDVIGFENNYSDVSEEIIDFLKTKKYSIIFKRLDIFMIHDDSEFIKNF